MIIQGGLNNILNGEDPAEIAKCMMDVAVRCLEKSPKCRIIISSVPFTNARGQETATNTAALNKALMRGCRDLKGAEFINTYWMLRDLPVKAMDGTHYWQAAQAVGEKLAQWAATFFFFFEAEQAACT